MISNSEFEKLWVLYKTEGEPKGVSINAFCVSRGVNYREFFDEAGYLMDFGFGGFIGYGKGVSCCVGEEELKMYEG